ncbi:hypothetical protein ACQPZP_34735 [Spirillospora sp. CA-142024]
MEGMVFRQLLSLMTLSAGRFVVGNSVVLDLGDGRTRTGVPGSRVPFTAP